MIPLQILGAALLVSMLAAVIFRWRAGSLKFGGFVLWMFLFGSILTALLAPRAIIKAARLLGIDRGTDFVVYASVALLFFFVFRIYLRLEEIEHQIASIVSAIALEKLDSVEPPRSMDRDVGKPDLEAKETQRERQGAYDLPLPSVEHTG